MHVNTRAQMVAALGELQDPTKGCVWGETAPLWFGGTKVSAAVTARPFSAKADSRGVTLMGTSQDGMTAR